MCAMSKIFRIVFGEARSVALQAILGALFTAVASFVQRIRNKPFTFDDAAIVFGVSLLLLVGIFALERLRRTKVTETENDLRPPRRLRFGVVTLGIMLLALAGMAVWNYQLQRRVRHLEVQMIRFAVPRTMTEAQMTEIGEHLKKLGSHEITMRVVADNEEAGAFSSYLRTAFERGGWPVVQTTMVPSTPTEPFPSGVSISVTGKTARELTAAEKLNSPVPLGQSIAAAFKESGFFDMGWGGPGADVELKDVVITVVVGRRNIGPWGVQTEKWQERMKSTVHPPRTMMPQPDDEDF